MTAEPTRPLFSTDETGTRQVATGVGDRRLKIWQWTDSHSFATPDPGPHIAVHGKPQQEGRAQSWVIALDQVPALVAALTAAATELGAAWARQEQGTPLG
jgi:hypothetical protein